MIIELQCSECDIDFSLEFDELTCECEDEDDPLTPEFCPFCGCELDV